MILYKVMMPESVESLKRDQIGWQVLYEGLVYRIDDIHRHDEHGVCVAHMILTQIATPCLDGSWTKLILGEGK